MGLFDYIRCEFPLPAPDCEGLLFQTKDTPDQYMVTYVIKADGSLWEEKYDTEDRSDPDATGSMKFVGSQTRINKRLVACPDFIGEIEFGEIFKKPEGGYYELDFSSYFVKGVLQQIHLISDTRPKVDAQGAVK